MPQHDFRVIQGSPVGIDPGFGHWLAGFIDGEGCFRIFGSEEANYYPRFCIMLRADDFDALMMIRRVLGGSVKRRKTYGNSSPGVIYQLDGHERLGRLVELLDAYPLRTRKARDFAIWREAVLARCAIPALKLNHVDRQRLNRLYVDLQQQLTDMRVFREVAA